MRRTLQKFLMLLLMLILPVQGISAAFAPMHKALGTQTVQKAMPATPCHESPTAHNAQDGTVQDADAANHMCCQQIFSCVISEVIAVGSRKFSDVPRFAPVLATLYIPDSLYRPPRG